MAKGCDNVTDVYEKEQEVHAYLTTFKRNERNKRQHRNVIGRAKRNAHKKFAIVVNP